MKPIEEGNCVMCNKKGEYLVEETNELLCLRCWEINDCIKKGEI